MTKPPQSIFGGAQVVYEDAEAEAQALAERWAALGIPQAVIEGPFDPSLFDPISPSTDPHW